MQTMFADPLKFNPENHTYEVGGTVYPSVTQCLRSVGLIDFSGIDQLILERAAGVGRAVHEASHYYDEGELDFIDLDPYLVGYVTAWQKFREQNPAVFDQIEVPLCSTTYGFAGCPDRVATIDGKPAIIEIKTSSVVPAWGKIQTAAYAILADVPAARRIIVHLKSNGSYSIIECKGRRDREVFLACLAVHQWRVKYGTHSL